MPQRTPKGFRLHIGLFGRRNAGKSSLLNTLTRQQVAIVSDVAGTTTDPVEKPMEMLPLGPVVFIDTAGIDDSGALGELRMAKTRQVIERTDVGLIVVDCDLGDGGLGDGKPWGDFEKSILAELRLRKVPVIVVFNKTDLAEPEPAVIAELDSAGTPWVKTAAVGGQGTLDVRAALVKIVPNEFINHPPIISDLVPAGELAMLVVPIDYEAPKGRIILPQVQTIRDLLDGDAYCMVVKEHQLAEALARLKRPPAIVVTDSQAFDKVADDTPADIPLTSFSILFARQKGDLAQFVEGTMAIKRLVPGDRVLIAEACAHHPIKDDIGREKIPQWLCQYVGGDLHFDTVQGHDFPENLADYKLVVHCGSCMWNRREVLSRQMHCRRAGVPMSNYGTTIAYALNLFQRALEPFPEALEVYHRLRTV